MSTLDPEALALLAAIAADVRALREAADRGRDGSSLSREDRASLGVLLPQIAASIGSGIVVTTHDLTAQAEMNPQLRASLSSVFGEINGKTPRRAGKLFSRSIGYVHAGLRVERSGSVREGALWRIDEL